MRLVFILAALFLVFLLQILVYNQNNENSLLKNSVFDGTNGCNPVVREVSLIPAIATDSCLCKEKSWLYKKLVVTKATNSLDLELCADKSGGDGVKAEIYVDGQLFFEKIVQSKTCVSESLNFTRYADMSIHEINLTSEQNGICDAEYLLWKEVVLR